MNSSDDDRAGTLANGAVIVAARKAQGLSQEQLAADVGCAVRTLRNAEKSKRVRIGFLADIAAALSLEVHQILGVSEQSPLAEIAAPLDLTIPDRAFNLNRSPPGALLRAEFRQVPFHSREDEIVDLDAWCDDDEPVRLRLYTGPGGMGKTRLLVEQCHARRAAGWLAGFVSGNAPELAAAKTTPTFIVLDYAETSRPILTEMVTRALAHTSGKTRIVLLARAATDWWYGLQSEPGEVGDFFQCPLTEKRRLAPLALDLKERQHSYALARSAFALALDKPEPKPMPESLGNESFERVLLIHMLALSALEGIETSGEYGILDVMLARERRHWRERAKNVSLPDHLLPAISQAMGAITLLGGVALGEVPRLLARLPLLTDQSAAIREQVLRLLHAIYPGEDAIEPLMPDLLGEHLFSEELTGCPSLSTLAAGLA